MNIIFDNDTNYNKYQNIETFEQLFESPIKVNKRKIERFEDTTVSSESPDAEGTDTTEYITENTVVSSESPYAEGTDTTEYITEDTVVSSESPDAEGTDTTEYTSVNTISPTSTYLDSNIDGPSLKDPTIPSFTDSRIVFYQIITKYISDNSGLSKYFNIKEFLHNFKGFDFKEFFNNMSNDFSITSDHLSNIITPLTNDSEGEGCTSQCYIDYSKNLEDLSFNKNTNTMEDYIKEYVAINVNKYFFVSELFLRILLDTTYNIYEDSEGTKETEETEEKEKEIINNYYDYSTEGIFKDLNNIKYKGNNGDSQEINKDNCNINTKIDKIKLLLKNMYQLIYLINYNITLIENEIKKPLMGTQKTTDSDKEFNEKLENKIKNTNENINNLNTKYNIILNNKKRYSNYYYILIFLIIIYVFVNIFMVIKGLGTVIILNSVIIILILIYKGKNFSNYLYSII